MTKEIELSVPGLNKTPGWESLSPEKQRRMAERTSRIVGARRAQIANVVSECRDLYMQQQDLEGEKMTMGNYLATVYGGSERTGWDRLKGYRDLAKYLTPEEIDALADDPTGVFLGGGGLRVGDVIRSAKQLPAPKSNRKDPKVIEGRVVKLRELMKEDRRERRRGRPRLDPDDATKMFVTFGQRVLSQAKINDSAGQRAFLKKAVGYLMERRGITGTVATERLPIPDDFMPKVGRPRKHVKVA